MWKNLQNSHLSYHKRKLVLNYRILSTWIVNEFLLRNLNDIFLCYICKCQLIYFERNSHQIDLQTAQPEVQFANAHWKIKAHQFTLLNTNFIYVWFANHYSPNLKNTEWMLLHGSQMQNTLLNTDWHIGIMYYNSY